ncbi:Endolytic murein transglycosylase [Halomonadaceae bacterium LMG 33818]|uniref:endolytic transglycosylase MltG n=1 Tax=Cernens ardua TaxID=3402176 RepID=UPI003EDB81F1
MLKWLFGLIVIIVLIVGGGTAYWRHELNSPIALKSPQIYEVHEGDGIRATLLRLKSEGVIRQQWPLQLLEIVNRRALTGLKAGEFRLEPNMTLLQMLRKLSSNDVVTYTITVPEGRNFAEMRELFDQAPKLRIETAGLDDQALMTRIGHPNEQPEGRFFPATYRYTKGTTDIQLYRQAYNLMSRTLNEVWNNRAPDLPYDSPYQALIMASLVEEEAARASERAKIAGVFVRRLEKGMRLQTDPSVVYGLHLTSGNQLTRADLLQKTPYNTYRISGLTPTPIALPGYASLEAAVHPEDGDALYFVAKGNGYHQFSATLQEHDAAVKRYILNAHASVDQGLGTEIDDSVIALGSHLLADDGAVQTGQSSTEDQGNNDQGSKNTSVNAKESDDSADNKATDKTSAGADADMANNDLHSDKGESQPMSHTTLSAAQIKGVNILFQCANGSAESSNSDSHPADKHQASPFALQSGAVCHAMAVFDEKQNTEAGVGTSNDEKTTDDSSSDLHTEPSVSSSGAEKNASVDIKAAQLVAGADTTGSAKEDADADSQYVDVKANKDDDNTEAKAAKATDDVSRVAILAAHHVLQKEAGRETHYHRHGHKE